MSEKPMVQCQCGEEVSEEELLARLDGVLEEYRDKPGALIPVLQIAQGIFGYLPEPALKKIALGLNKSYSEVAGVVSFYSFFSTTPRGKNLVRVCLGTACYVRGGKRVLDTLKQKLGIDVGETHAGPALHTGSRPVFRGLRPGAGDHDQRRRAPSRQTQQDGDRPEQATRNGQVHAERSK